jgi:hypothetical protein
MNRRAAALSKECRAVNFVPSIPALLGVPDVKRTLTGSAILTQERP